MNPENAIEVKNVKKRFKVYMDKGSSMKEKMLFRSRNRYEERWVLNGVSFSVKKGEAIGLIGKNGCGKSTTLKMLTRIMYPTEGTIEMCGRVSSLIELGAGFHPDMSGRENIFTNASIFGLNHAEIERRLDDIIAFSELEEFIDNPVRTYSSGMYMRLAFAVAINVDADILLIDEILAVGDVSFQTKCFEKLKEIKRNGTTIVIVSHVMSQIEQICDRAIWIEEGLLMEDGKPRDVGQHYLASMEDKRLKKKEEEFEKEKTKDKVKAEPVEEKKTEKKQEKKRDKVEEKKIENTSKLPLFSDKNAVRRGSLEVEITDFKTLTKDDEEKIVFSTEDTIKFVIAYKSKIENAKVDFRLGIARDDGVHCYGISTYAETGEEVEIAGQGTVTLEIERNMFLSGKYLIDIGIKTVDQIAYDVISGVRAIQIRDNENYESGIARMDHTWTID